VRGESLPLSERRETYKDLTFSETTQWSNTHLLRFESWKEVVLNRTIIVPRYNRGKSNRVVVRLRIGYDFSMGRDFSRRRDHVDQGHQDSTLTA
jgi:hypothetical protein